MVDTHAHLTDKAFDEDRDEVIKRARETGINKIICILCEFSDERINIFKKLLRENFIFGAVGVHPQDAKDYEKNKKTFLELLELPKIVALGEMGFDYHYMHSQPEDQKRVFEDQLKIAKEKNLPVIIHSREASEDTFALIRDLKPAKAVMHCFSGDEKEAKAYLDMGFYISFAGPITFKNAAKAKEVLKIIPEEKLLLETDCPYLSPQAFRGSRNEPSYIKYTFNEAALLRNTEMKKLAQALERNSAEIFKTG